MRSVPMFRAALAVILTIGTVTAIRGETKPSLPVSYTKATPDGQHVFVMLAPGSDLGDSSFWLTIKAADMRSRRVEFTRSGMYRNDGSGVPLWTVNWYASNVYIASDGVHLIRMGGPAENMRSEAVAYYANGKLLKTFVVDDFVDFSRFLPKSLKSDQGLNWLESEKLEEPTRSHILRTNDGNRFVIDYQTGQITSSSRPYRFGVRLALGIAIVFVAVWVAKLSRQYWKHREDMKALQEKSARSYR
jgi:hypothetical protein